MPNEPLHLLTFSDSSFWIPILGAYMTGITHLIPNTLHTIYGCPCACRECIFLNLLAQSSKRNKNKHVFIMFIKIILVQNEPSCKFSIIHTNTYQNCKYSSTPHVPWRIPECQNYLCRRSLVPQSILPSLFCRVTSKYLYSKWLFIRQQCNVLFIDSSFQFLFLFFFTPFLCLIF